MTASFKEWMASGLSMNKLFGEAAKDWDKTFGPLPDKQRTLVMSISNCFDAAADAYGVLADKSKTPLQKIQGAGAFAEKFFFIYDSICEELRTTNDKFKGNNEEIEKSFSKTADYLQSNGWHGLPTQTDDKGVVHYKTFAGILSDMKRIRDAVWKWRSAKQTLIEESKKK